MDEFLEIRDLSKSYGIVHALKKVGFSISRGEVHALLGENGAGKSTLIKIISGEEFPSSGSLFINGREVRDFNPAHAMAKNEARDASEKVIRPFVNEFIRFGPITDAERLEAGCHVADGTRSPDTKPEGIPEAEVDSSVIRVLTIHFKPAGSLSKAKPKGVHGAEIRWAILDAPPVDETDLSNSDFDTASPFTLNFHESQRGKRVYFCLRWESRTNIKGDFGEIYSAIIP
jgi:energy-coupling factor transporter ATP-binding protein EcfA2